MSRKTAVSAIGLIRTRRIASKSLPTFGKSVQPFSHFCSNFHYFSRKDEPFSSMPPRLDFSCVNGLDDAIRLFNEMLRMRPQPSVVGFAKLLSSVVKMKHYSVALYLFDEMRLMDAPVSEYTLNIAINCYFRLKRVDFGFALMGTFFKSGYEPNAATFSTLIKGLFLDDRVADAVRLFKKTVDFKLCEPNNDVMILTVTDGLCKAGRIVEARDLVCRLERRGWTPDVKAYNALLDGLCKDGEMKEAEDVLEIMMHRNICPNIVTYNALIDGYCLQGEVDKAKQVFELIEDRGLKRDIISYNSLINGYCKKGRVNEAWLLFVEIPCKGLEHNTYTYNTMIHGLFSNERFDDGWKLFKDMEALRVDPDILTYNILLDGLCKTGNTAEAISLLHMIEEKGVNPDIVTYGALINGLCKNGKLDVARDLLNQLPARGLQPDVQIYTR